MKKIMCILRIVVYFSPIFCQVLINEYSASNLTIYIDNYQMEFSWLQGFTYLLRGKTYDILGHRLEAKSDYKNVLEMDYFYKEVKEAKIYLESAFSLRR